MSDGCLDTAPILADASVIAEFCQKNNVQADGVTGGFPCQGTSSAGQRQGLQDPRTGLVQYLFHCFDSVNAQGTQPESATMCLTAITDIVLVRSPAAGGF